MNQIQQNIFDKSLSRDLLISEACRFAEQPRNIGELSGPVIGDAIERQFNQHLLDRNYQFASSRKGSCDYWELNIDLKSLQIRGARGGAAKIHGYSKGGPPKYSLLILLYEYRSPIVTIDSVAFVPADRITWVQANHYLWSVPDRLLERFIINHMEGN